MTKAFDYEAYVCDKIRTVNPDLRVITEFDDVVWSAPNTLVVQQTGGNSIPSHARWGKSITFGVTLFLVDTRAAARRLLNDTLNSLFDVLAISVDVMPNSQRATEPPSVQRWFASITVTFNDGIAPS